MKTTKRASSPSLTRPAAPPRRATRPLPAAPRTRRAALKSVPSPEDIARRAYEIFLGRTGDGGDAMTDWLQAERELTAPARSPRPRSNATA